MLTRISQWPQERPCRLDEKKPGETAFFRLLDPRGKTCVALDDGMIHSLPLTFDAVFAPTQGRGLPGPPRHDLIPGGIVLYAGNFHCARSDEYSFEVSDDHVNLSYCMEGQASAEVFLGQGGIHSITQNPATCTASYLPRAHGQWRPTRGSCRLFTLRLSVEGFETLCRQLLQARKEESRKLPRPPSPFYITATASPAMMVAAHSLEQALDQGPRVDLLLHCKILELAMLMVAQLHEGENALPQWETPLSKNDVENLRLARDILLDEMSQPPSLTQLARRAGINEFKLKRGFRQVFGITPYGFLRAARLDQAKRYLENGEMNVCEACLAVGYSNPGHFSGAFKRRFGIAPGWVRQSALRHAVDQEPR